VKLRQIRPNVRTLAGSPDATTAATLMDPTSGVRRRKYRTMYRLLIERSDKKEAKKSGSSTAGTAAIKVVLAPSTQNA
jgi:hypothetical protein